MKLKTQRRFQAVESIRLDAEARTISFPFSSENPVERWYGNEVLMHDQRAVRMDRLNQRAPLLFNHNMDDVVGVIEGASLNQGDRRLYANVRFAKTARADEVLGMVKDGILSNVSFAYRIHAAEEDKKANVYRVTDWEPLEVSVVTVPADPSVGIGRAYADEEMEVQIRTIEQTAQAATTKEPTMTVETSGAAAVIAEPNSAVTERLRIKALTDMCRQHKIDEKTRDDWVNDGVTIDEAAAKTLDIIAARTARTPHVSAAHVGLSNDEIRKYSLFNAMRAVLDKNWSRAGLEFEAHKAISQRTGQVVNENTFYVPLEVQQRQVAKRDLTAASAAGGGYLVETQNIGFIDLMRNRSVVFNMGARRLSGLVGSVTVPKQSAAGTAYWLANESTAITESQQTFAQMALSPKTVGAYTEISRQLLLQSSPDAEGLVMSDLASVVALAVDSAALNGSGSGGQPQGVIGTSGVGSVTGTTLGYAGIVEFQTDIAAGNLLTDTCGYVTTPVVAGLLKGRVKFSNTASPIWEGRLENGVVDGYRAMSSNQVPTADMIFGDWSQIVVAEWGVLAVEANPYANFQAGIVGVRAMYSVDVGVRYAAAFSVATVIT